MKKTAIQSIINKSLILIFVFVFAAVSLGVKDESSNAVEFAASTRFMYPSLDVFGGASVKLTGDERLLATNDPEIEKLLKSTAKGGEYLDSYYFKNTSSIIMASAAIISGVWLCADAISYQVQNDKLGPPLGIKEASLVVVLLGGTILGSYLQLDGYDDLFKAINQYNISVSGATGVVVGKNIKF